MRVHTCRLKHVKDVKTLPAYEIEDEKDQTNITTAEISKNETLKIYDESGLSTTTSGTIVNKNNSQSSNNKSQNIPNVVKSISDNTKDDISDSAYRIKTYVKLPKINETHVRTL